MSVADNTTITVRPKEQEHIIKVKEIRKLLKIFCEVMYENCGGAEVVDEIMAMRHYTDDRMRSVLLEKGVFKMPTLSGLQVYMAAKGIKLTSDKLRLMGLVGENGGFWLEERYAIPLRDWMGNPIALVCWYPDNRKYITTSTIGFTSTATFFNMQSVTKAELSNGKTCAVVVEGIFDALSVESLGYCALGNQGLDLSAMKKEMLSRFDTVVFIPDNDRPGRASNPYATLRSSHLWETDNSKLVQLSGRCKDMDDLIKTYRIETLDDVINAKSKYIKVKT